MNLRALGAMFVLATGFETAIVGRDFASGGAAGDRQIAVQQQQEPTQQLSDTDLQLRALLTRAAVSARTALDRLVVEFYERRDLRPAWLDDRGPTAALGLLARARDAHRDGLCLPPDGIDALESVFRAASLPTPAVHAALDLATTRLLMDYVVRLALGHDAVDDRAASMRNLDVVSALEAVRQSPSTMSAVAPGHPEYAALRSALAQYQQFAAVGGWPTLDVDGLLRPGDDAGPELLSNLRTRLQMTGDLPSSAGMTAIASGVYDDELAAAVERWQTRHGLLVDGIIGPSTLAAMNVPASARAAQIALNMDRWRRLPEALGERHVRVNIPEFQLRLVDRGDVTLAMKVVVGTLANQTPVFSDRIRYLQFRPYWNVPVSIVRNEILPQAVDDPNYLRDRRFEVLDGWGADAEAIDPASIDWEAERFNYRIRQRPGGDNALGLVKFMFPNRYSVYLHDTPARGVFTHRVRAFSHGCVRVKDPVALATALLQPQEDWTTDEVSHVMQHGPRQRIDLDEPVPVHLMYLTAWVDEAGEVQFRPDIYGRDRRMHRQMDCVPVPPVS